MALQHVAWEIWLLLWLLSSTRGAGKGCVYQLRTSCPDDLQDVVAFFHPFADGGGGGERVLW